MSKKISDCVILFGGKSEERLVSVASAQNLSSKLSEAALWFMTPEGAIHKVSTEELAKHADPFMTAFKPSTPTAFADLKQSLSELKDKTVIMGLHGTEGEDGQMQKQFEDAGISFTGTGSKASALAFDKVVTKKIARENKLAVVEELTIENFTEAAINELRNFLATHGKIVLKPYANGSSVGLFIISSEKDLNESLATIKNKGLSSYIAEPFIVGREITVGVRQKKDGTYPLPCSEVRVIQGRQFDYEGKYLGSGVEELTPAPLTPAETKLCQDLALKTHQVIGCRGYTRTDMILTEKGPILLEINTLPGLSKASFIPQQLIAAGENLRDFFLEQINL